MATRGCTSRAASSDPHVLRALCLILSRLGLSPFAAGGEDSTFQFSASSCTNVYGPRSSGRFRNPSMSSSSSAVIALTCDLDRPTTPREPASFSTRRVETPSRYDVATTEASARSARRRCSSKPGKYDPWRP